VKSKALTHLGAIVGGLAAGLFFWGIPESPNSVVKIIRAPASTLPGISTTCLSPEAIVERGCARAVTADMNCGSGSLGAYTDSCFSENLSARIPTLLDPTLREFDTSVIDHYSVDVIARNLVERIYRIHERDDRSTKDLQTPTADFYANSELQIAFFSGHFADILKGGWLNTYQTRNNGEAYIPMRLNVESRFLDLDIHAIYPSLPRLFPIFPKYAFFVPTRPIDGVHPHHYDFEYGNLLAVLTDDVRDRTTFAPADSFDEKLKEIHTLRLIKPTKDLKKESTHFVHYFEAQIWGSLGFSNVRYFLANCPGAETLPENRVAEIAASGLSVYSCKRVDVSGGDYMVRDQLLAGPGVP
jgi:hypothetical protein